LAASETNFAVEWLALLPVEGTGFETRPEKQLYSLRCFLVSAIAPDKFQDSAVKCNASLIFFHFSIFLICDITCEGEILSLK
jgi:hypothetical protein